MVTVYDPQKITIVIFESAAMGRIIAGSGMRVPKHIVTLVHLHRQCTAAQVVAPPAQESVRLRTIRPATRPARAMAVV